MVDVVSLLRQLRLHVSMKAGQVTVLPITTHLPEPRLNNHNENLTRNVDTNILSGAT